MNRSELHALMSAIVLTSIPQDIVVENRMDRAVKQARVLLDLCCPDKKPEPKAAPVSKTFFTAGDIPGLNEKAFAEYVEYRREAGKPLSKFGQKVSAKKLAASGDADFQAKVVGRSIENAWLGLFPESTPGSRQAQRSNANTI